MTQDVVGSVAAGVPLEFPMARGCPLSPPGEYEVLRREAPIAKVRLPSGGEAWLVTRYEDIRRLLTDRRISSDRRYENLPLTEPVTPESRKNIAKVGRALVGLDPPEHGVRRRMLISEFTVRRVKAMRPYIQSVVDRCLAEVQAGPQPADLVTGLALQVPSLVLCEMFGVPEADRGFFERSSTTQLRRSIPPEERQRVAGELRAYLDQLVADKEANPGNDLLGRLIRRNRQTKVYDHEMLVFLTMFLLIAGHETTANMISLGILGLLLQDPRQRAAMIDDPQALTVAVEELLRYFSVVDALPRVATEDIQVGGVTIKAGDGVLIAFAAGNHDEDIFPKAGNLDLSRNARYHVAFGWGAHQCLGQNLAREELHIVFRTLFSTIPTLKLAVPVEELPFKDDSNIFGLDRLPVTW